MYCDLGVERSQGPASLTNAVLGLVVLDPVDRIAGSDPGLSCCVELGPQDSEIAARRWLGRCTGLLQRVDNAAKRSVKLSPQNSEIDAGRRWLALGRCRAATPRSRC